MQSVYQIATRCPAIARRSGRSVWSRAIALILLSAFTASVIALPANAQDAFSRIGFGADIAKDVRHADFQKIWSTGLAADVYAETPFYLGQVRIAARYLHAVSTSVTDIRTLHVRASWGPVVPLGNRVVVTPAVSVGNLLMSFQDEPVSFRRQESELAFGASAGFAVRISDNLSWVVSTEFVHAFTSRPVDFTFVSSGIKYELHSPDWLRRFLD